MKTPSEVDTATKVLENDQILKMKKKGSNEGHCVHRVLGLSTRRGRKKSYKLQVTSLKFYDDLRASNDGHSLPKK